ncbi:MAG: FAD-dependent thymidylate synthase [Leptospiraceae bacterium]|nr:FAD-dependent thymidylate synthase [Leptospiraceae bacterium]MDW7976702.1 FAD-dependent thymidylate synthase [Leptospiraceae bacterium]
MKELIVELIDYTKRPFDLSIATARTCYSSKGIIYPEEISKDESSIVLRDRVAKITLEGGHLTTRQHPQFIFAIKNISRIAVWSFLHSHPYYNSEQVSQRYVKVKKDQFYVPKAVRKNEKWSELYNEIIEFQMNTYYDFIEKLKPFVEKEYFRIFPYRKKTKEKWLKDIEKKAMELARYVLPLATFTYLYHTVNGLTLHRYRRMAMINDVPDEISELVQKMWENINKIDPLYAKEITDPIPLEETPEYHFFKEHYQEISSMTAMKFIEYFDAKQGELFSKLVSFTSNPIEILKESFYSVFGFVDENLSDDEILTFFFSPTKNKHLGSVFNETMHSKLNSILNHIHFVFQKKISHTADSQDQRHRMVPSSKPYLIRHYTGKPDYIIPKLIKENEEILEYYVSFMNRLYAKINEFVERTNQRDLVVYLLPNAFPVRYYESGTLIYLIHKWKMRTCYNAQEEIFHASVEEIRQIEEAIPQFKGFFGAPCKLRKEAQIKPYCPEGERFCGVSVWNLSLSQYQRIL